MNSKRIKFLFVFTLVLSVLVIYSVKNPVRSATDGSGVVISEVQISGDSTGYDFVELYNPTDNPVDLADYRLVKRTSSGDTDTNISAFQSGDEIPAHGFFLWCNNDLAIALNCDRSTSQTISNNNSVGLRVGDLDTGTLLDSVTFGSPDFPLGESDFIGSGSVQVPGDNESVERKACANSTFSTMTNGHSLFGNGYDSDNNTSDFINRSSADPQNSSSSTETQSCTDVPTSTPTVKPTPTSEVTPTVEPTPTDGPTPTEEPEPTITPTAEPTMTPVPTATETLEPTPTDSEEPAITPTVEPTPTDEATPTPTETPETDSKVIGFFPLRNTVCRISYRLYRFGFFKFFFPRIVCN